MARTAAETKTKGIAKWVTKRANWRRMYKPLKEAKSFVKGFAIIEMPSREGTISYTRGMRP